MFHSYVTVFQMVIPPKMVDDHPLPVGKIAMIPHSKHLWCHRSFWHSRDVPAQHLGDRISHPNHSPMMSYGMGSKSEPRGTIST